MEDLEDKFRRFLKEEEDKKKKGGIHPMVLLFLLLWPVFIVAKIWKFFFKMIRISINEEIGAKKAIFSIILLSPIFFFLFKFKFND